MRGNVWTLCPQSLNKIIRLEFQWVRSSCGHLVMSPLAPPANCKLGLIYTGAPCSRLYEPAALRRSAGSTDLMITSEKCDGEAIETPKSKYKNTKMDYDEGKLRQSCLEIIQGDQTRDWRTIFVSLTSFGTFGSCCRLCQMELREIISSNHHWCQPNQICFIRLCHTVFQSCLSFRY